jgi:hypothetical protein
MQAPIDVKKILLDYEYDQIAKYYTAHISNSIFNIEQLSIDQFNHRGSSTLGKNFFKRFPILESNLDNIFGKDNYVGRFFATKPNSKGFVHIDMAHGELTPRYWSLNIPIFNCQGNYHEWFTTVAESDLISKEFNSWFWTTDANVQLIDKLELDSPYFVSVSVPHRINNTTNEVRVVFAVRSIDNKPFEFL